MVEVIAAEGYDDKVRYPLYEVPQICVVSLDRLVVIVIHGRSTSHPLMGCVSILGQPYTCDCLNGYFSVKSSTY